jgi:hypothetical protein
LIEAQTYVGEASYRAWGGFKYLFDGYFDDALAKRAAKYGFNMRPPGSVLRTASENCCQRSP